MQIRTICESCAKLCHSGHDLDDLHYVRGYCRCGQGTTACYCFCQNPIPNMLAIPLHKNRQCDFLKNGKHLHNLEVCQCQTCDMGCNSCMCMPCSVMCHYNHTISNIHNSYRAYCDCGDPSQPEYHQYCKITNVINKDPIPICTSLLFKNDTKQKKFFCNTCDETHDFPICSFCINCCHNGHNIVNGDDSTFSCSCGTRKLNCKCKILSKIEPAA